MLIKTKTEKTKLNTFLKSFNNPTLCYATGNERSSRMQNRDVTLDVLKIQNGKYGRDAYFYVNGGGTKLDDVNQINALFIDLDAGKDAKSNYLPEREVNERKVKMLAAVKKFHIPPSYVVETRNGYHVYWLLKGCKLGNLVQKRNEIINKWKTIENQLLFHFSEFGADKWVARLNQILRLPYSIWSKPWSKLPQHRTNIVMFNPSIVYTLDQVAKKMAGFSTYNPYTKENKPTLHNSSLPWANHWRNNLKPLVNTPDTENVEDEYQDPRFVNSKLETSGYIYHSNRPQTIFKPNTELKNRFEEAVFESNAPISKELLQEVKEMLMFVNKHYVGKSQEFIRGSCLRIHDKL